MIPSKSKNKLKCVVIYYKFIMNKTRFELSSKNWIIWIILLVGALMAVHYYLLHNDDNSNQNRRRRQFHLDVNSNKLNLTEMEVELQTSIARVAVQNFGNFRDILKECWGFLENFRTPSVPDLIRRFVNGREETGENNEDANSMICRDFYEYVRINKVLPAIDEGKFTNDVYADARKKMKNGIQDCVNSFITRNITEDEPISFYILHNFLNLCNQRDDIRNTSISELQSIINKTLNGWPVNPNSSGLIDWTAELNRLKHEGFFYKSLITFDLKIYKNNYNQYMYTIILKSPKFSSNSQISFNDMKNIGRRLKLFGDENVLTKITSYVKSLVSSNNVEDELRNIANLEMNLKRNADNEQNHRTDQIPFTKLTADFNYINWAVFLEEALNDIDSQMKYDEMVTIEESWHYYETLGNITSNNSIMVVNFIRWKAIEDQVVYLTPILQFFKFFNSSINKLTLQSRPPKRMSILEKCIEEAKILFPLPFQSLYLRKNVFPKKDLIKDIPRYIRLAFIVIIGRFAWMDEDTREKAKMKIHNLHVNWMYGDMDNNTLLNLFYEDKFDFDQSTTYLRAIMAAQRHLTKTNVETAPYIKGWKIVGVFDNTVYWYEFNRISISGLEYTVPALSLSNDTAMATNYARFGFKIAREMVNGVVEKGAEYVDDGKRSDWWSNLTQNNFNQLLFDHNRTLDKSMLDLVAAEIANNGYRLYTILNEEAFWIDFVEGRYTRNGENKENVLNVISNLSGFSNCFLCPLGSPMNPQEKFSLLMPIN